MFGDSPFSSKECDVNISVQPGDSVDATAISISGTEHAVGRAVAQIELQFKAFAEAPGTGNMTTNCVGKNGGILETCQSHSESSCFWRTFSNKIVSQSQCSTSRGM